MKESVIINYDIYYYLLQAIKINSNVARVLYEQVIYNVTTTSQCREKHDDPAKVLDFN